MNESARKSLVPVLAVGVAALALGIYSAVQLNKAPASAIEFVTMLPEPRALPAVEMVDKNGQPADRASFAGHWSLVFMGFTSCGHVCPTKMAEMRMIHDQVEQPLQIVFISVDPNRDSPDIIKSYVESFDADFEGITGSEESIEALANALGAPYFVDPNPERYIVDHSSALFLIAPDAELAGVITPPLDISAIADELNRLL